MNETIKLFIMEKKTFFLTLILCIISGIPYFFLKYENISAEKIRIGSTIFFLVIAFFVQMITIFRNFEKDLPAPGKVFVGGLSMILFLGMVVAMIANILFLYQIANINDFVWQVKVFTGYIMLMFILNVIIVKFVNEKKDGSLLYQSM
jgi:hypothetical protein